MTEEQINSVLINPKPLQHDLFHYWMAPSGIGPLVDTWNDKPHRLLYDLIAHIRYLENKNVNKN